MGGCYGWLLISACNRCSRPIYVFRTSLSFPAVTNARVNGDSGLAVQSAVFSATLAALLGLGWSKDNLRLNAASQPGVSQSDVELQVILAALSLGPVGIADQLEGFPALPAPTAQVVTNKTLAMSLVSQDGHALQPSFPLTPLGPELAGTDLGVPAFGGPTAPRYHCWATYTAVGSAVWYTAVSFSWTEPDAPKRWPAPASWGVSQANLAALIDEEHLPPLPFAAIPAGGFRGAGAESLPGADSHVTWRRGATHATLWAPATKVNVRLAHEPEQTNVAPVLQNGRVLLGEAGKVAAVSTHRFVSVAASGADGIRVVLRGAPGERVELLHSGTSSGLEIKVTVAVIQGGGVVTVTL